MRKLSASIGAAILAVGGQALAQESLLTQTLSWTAPAADALELGTPYVLEAAASSSLPVTFRVVAGPGRIEAGSLTVTNVGIVDVLAAQAGDASYAPALVQRSFSWRAGPDTKPSALAGLPDGRIYAGGGFTSVAGVPVPGFARFREDLSLDPGFAPTNKVSSATIAVRPDASILVSSGSLLMRFDAGGSLDRNLGQLGLTSGGTSGLRMDGNGRAYLLGGFLTGGGYPATDGFPRVPDGVSFMRVTKDNALDPEFALNLDGGNIGSLSVGRRGNLWQHYQDIRRLRDDGGLIQVLIPTNGFTFNPTISYSTFRGVAVLAEDSSGRLLIAGGIDAIWGKPIPGWARIHSDGSLDATFHPTFQGKSISKLEVLPGGHILAGTFGDGFLREFDENGQLLVEYPKGFPFLVEPSGAILLAGPPCHRVYPMGYDPRPALYLPWDSLQVGEDASEIRIPVARWGRLDVDIQVRYEVRSGTADSGVDFDATNGVLRLPAGQRSMELVLPLHGQNEVPNDNRTILVSLLRDAGDGANAERASCEVTIRDDDTGLKSKAFAGPLSPGSWTSAPAAFLCREDQFRDPRETRLEGSVFHDWGQSAPWRAPLDGFAVAWTGAVVPETTGTYEFGVVVDDGVRLWVDGRLMIDRWSFNAATRWKSTVVNLEAGHTYPLALHYFESVGNAICRLYWKPPDAVGFVPIGRRYLRPRSPLTSQPRIELGEDPSGSVRLTLDLEAGGYLNLSTSTNGSQWKFAYGAVVRTNGIRESAAASDFSGTFRAGSWIRGTTLEGVVVTNLIPVLVAGGANRAFDLGSSENAVWRIMNPPTSGTISWLRDGKVFRVSPANSAFLSLNGQDAAAAGVFQAMVATPWGNLLSRPWTCSIQPGAQFEGLFSLARWGQDSSVVAMAGTVAFVAGSAGQLWVLDLVSSGSPLMLGQCALAASPTRLVLARNRLYVLEGPAGMEVLDVVDPARPVLLGHIDTDGSALDVVVSGSTVYLAEGAAGLRILGTGPADQLFTITRLATAGPAIRVDLDAARGILGVAEGSSGVQWVDVRAPATPGLAGEWSSTAAASTLRLLAPGMWLLSETNRLWVLDASELPNVTNRFTTLVSQQVVETVVQGDTVFATTASGDLLFIRVSPQGQLSTVATQPLASAATGIVCKDEMVLVPEGTAGLEILRFGPRQGQLIRWSMPALAVVGQPPMLIDGDLGSSSGLPIVVTLTSGPAQLSGHDLVFTGPGQVLLTAVQAGNRTFAPASTTRSIWVLPAPPRSLPESIRFDADGRLILQAEPDRNQSVTVLISEDLQVWRALGQFIGAGSPLTITDPRPDTKHRFYRLVRTETLLP